MKEDRDFSQISCELPSGQEYDRIGKEIVEIKLITYYHRTVDFEWYGWKRYEELFKFRKEEHNFEEQRAQILMFNSLKETFFYKIWNVQK